MKGMYFRNEVIILGYKKAVNVAEGDILKRMKDGVYYRVNNVATDNYMNHQQKDFSFLGFIVGNSKNLYSHFESRFGELDIYRKLGEVA